MSGTNSKAKPNEEKKGESPTRKDCFVPDTCPPTPPKSDLARAKRKSEIVSIFNKIFIYIFIYNSHKYYN